MRLISMGVIYFSKAIQNSNDITHVVTQYAFLSNILTSGCKVNLKHTHTKITHTML